MFEILSSKRLNESTYHYRIKAPLIAKKALPGQFLLIRANETAERIPLTIADYSVSEGWVEVIFQVVGKSTMILSGFDSGSFLSDVAGPLGTPSHLEGYSKVAVVGGGLGCAIAYPQAKHLHALGTSVDIIAGFRSKDLIILEEEMRSVCQNLFIVTDDGSNGNKALVTDMLKKLIETKGKDSSKYELVIAIGPPIMMKFVSLLTKDYNIKTVVSLNPIMVDGTGMCGCCRVIVGGETKFACTDGPDFDGHLTDFDSLIKRLQSYRDIEAEQFESHKCRIGLN